MNNGKYGKDLNSKAAQLELLIIAMVGATLGSLQIINFVFLNVDAHKTPVQPLLDWLFSIAIITFLVHFSFREIRKVQVELIEKSSQASKAQSRLQHIIDNTGDTIFVIDPQGNFKFASRSIYELTGYSAAETSGMVLADILADGYQALVQKELNDYRNLGGRHIYVDFRHKDGGDIRVELCFMKIETEDRGQVIQCLAREFPLPGDAQTRILGVCDVTECMISHRSYRQALPVEEVSEALVRGRGTQFDARAVECTLGVINRNTANGSFSRVKIY